jgi:D-hexose-6-phosphate mutarotase
MKVEPGNGGLERVRIENEECEAELYLNGATLTYWKPRSESEPVLWTSQRTNWIAGKAIRGGVPLCFPWFGPKEGVAQHGWARTSTWSLDQADDRQLVLSLPARDALAARYSVRFGAELSLEFTVNNEGPSPASVEVALHAYFRVSDPRGIQIAGLEGSTYLDKLRAGLETQQDGSFAISGETDRVYAGNTRDIELVDPGLNRKISVKKDRSHSTVVWNPWIEKAKALADFGDEEWKEMLCIEPANIGADALQLEPGESHTTSMRIVVQKIAKVAR